MKPYVDIFKKPIKKEEVAAAANLLVGANSTSTLAVRQHLGIGFGRAAIIVKVLKDANVIAENQSTVLLKNQSEAVNAALRQLKRGKK